MSEPLPQIQGRVPHPLNRGRTGALLQTETKPQQDGPPSLFDGLSPRERETVLAAGRRKVLYRGATLFTQGSSHDGIYIIETGRIRVFYTAPSGREVTLAYWHPGNFVGGPEVFGGGTHIWSGIAAANSSVLHMPGKVMRALVLEIPALAVGIIEAQSFKGKCYSTMAQMLGTRSITERLAHLLLHLADLYGIPSKDGTAIAAAFTHADLAHMVGSTRQWITISLKRLADQGIIANSSGDIVIRRPASLARMRDGEPSAQIQTAVDAN